MLRTILTYGVIAGIIVAIPMFAALAVAGPGSWAGSQLVGYGFMLLALSTIFVGVKSYRDSALGGVIKFLPALLIGLGISAVAGVVYVVGWEITLSMTNYAFIGDYSSAAIEAARAKGASPEEIETVAAQMATFGEQYRNPLFRIPITFGEIFPVGVIVSLLSAALLRNSRFLPARSASA